MTIPKLTNPQYRVLSLLRDGEIPGGRLREQLEARGQRSSAPVFHHFMSRLETAGHVHGRYEQHAIGNRAVTERVYSISSSGARAWADFQDFAVSPCGVRLRGV
jgi:hypothetical protein